MIDEVPQKREPMPRDFRGEIMPISELRRQPEERFYNPANYCYMELPDNKGRIKLTHISQAVMTGVPEVDSLLRNQVIQENRVGQASEEGTFYPAVWIAVADMEQDSFDLEAARTLLLDVKDVFVDKGLHLGIYVDPVKFREAAEGLGDNDGLDGRSLEVGNVTDRTDVPQGEIRFVN